MRVIRAFLTSIALIALAGPCWAHENEAEELGHHWYVPAYRIEMQTQIAIMAVVALAFLAASWLAKVINTRRSQE